MNKVLRNALTGSAFAGTMLFIGSPAQAACTATPAVSPVAGTVVCGTTVTANTTFPTNIATGTDREYLVDTSTTAFTGTVSTGATVSGFGLAFTNTVGGTNALNVVNNGTVQVDAANSPTVGGTAALNITGVGATPINYSGTGSIISLSPTATNGLRIVSSGTGNIVASVGGNVSNANNGFYAISLEQTGTAGNINLTTATGTSLLSPGAGIFARVTNAASAGTVTVTNNAAIGSPVATPNTFQFGITAFTSGTGAVTATNNGAIGTATDRAQVNGIDADITNAASAATLRVDGSGAIFSVGDGITVTNSGTGLTQVVYTGAINTTAGSGIEAIGTTGAMTVSTGAITALGAPAVLTTTTTGNQTITLGGAVTSDQIGVDANSTSGNLTVNVNGGNLTATGNAIDLATSGATTVTIAATRTVSGDIGIFSTGGTLTVNNNGTLTGTGAGGDAIFTGGLTVSTINNNAGATLNGDVDLGAGADTVNNRGTWNSAAGSRFLAGADVLNNLVGGVINLDGVIDFGTEADTFANTGGTINILANSTLTGLEAFSTTGTINFTAGTTLTGPAIAFVNGPGGLIDTAGAATIAGFTSLTNSGTVDLAAATFTVPAGVFTNNATGIIIADEGATTITGQTSFVNDGILDLLDGARNDSLTINSSYSGTGDPTARLQVDVSGTAADTLIVNGNVTGATFIDVNTVGLGVFDPDGMLVVDVTGAFTSTEGAFIMGEESGNPLINYDVQRIGQDFFLVTLLDPETAFIPLAATGLIREMWYQSADEVFAHTLAPSAHAGLSVWGEVYGGQRRTGMTNSQTVNDVQYDADNNIEIDRYGIQAGVGYGWGMAEVGLTAGYANAQANGDGEFDADGWNIGIYGRYGGLTGFHAEALFKHDSYDVEFDGLFEDNDGDASSTGVDGSVGYRFAMGVVPSIDVHAGVSHVWSDMDGVSAFGFDYDIDDMTSTRGRLGIRGNFGGDYNPYLGLTGYHEFSGDGDVTITQGAFSDSLSSTGKGTWARVEGGLAGGRGTHGLNIAGWVDIGDTRGAGIRAGFRF